VVFVVSGYLKELLFFHLVPVKKINFVLL